MKQEELRKILEDHKKWLNNGCGRRANLCRVDLSGAYLSGADLCGANLSGADLRGADLSRANLYGADLSGVDLHGADLRGADLHGANLREVNVDCWTIGYHLACPEEGSFIGYKKAADKIVVLEITADAKRSSATSVKCRCSKAKVLRIENLDGTPADISKVPSGYDYTFIYKIGEIVEVPDFDDDRWNACSHGIHFFLNKDNAKNYNQS